jgi:hypothetical protein
MLYPFSLKAVHIKYFNITLLSVILFFVASEHIRLRDKPSPNNQVSSDHWLQPAELDVLYPQLISDDNWELDFIKIEEVIRNLKIDFNQELLINSDNADKLQLVIAQLDMNLPIKEWARLEFLIKQSLGENIGKSFYTLVNSYYHYQQDQTSYLEKIKHANPNEKLALLKDSEIKYLKMQSHHFGSSIAKQLFERKNKTTNYLNSRRIVSMTKELSSAQKKEQLSLLSKNYKQSLIQQ